MMKRRKPLLQSLLGKFRKTTVAAEVQARPFARKPAERKVVSSIEGLEGRIAPATLLNASTVSYVDFDGDLVTLKFNKNILTAANANAVLKFSAGTVLDPSASDATAGELQLIDLTQVAATANGVSFTVLATAAGGGNGQADVGAIRATSGTPALSIALGAVTIDGDLGQVDAGRAGVKTALVSLNVGSLGVRGIASQDAGSSPELTSTLRGALGSLKVLGDVKDARVNVINGTAANGITPLGNIGNIVIEGSLIGNPAVGAGSNNSGRIDAPGNVGAVRIGTDAGEGIFGGGGEGSGQITVGGKIASLTVSGGIVGGAGVSSGTVFAGSTIGPVKIGLDATGGITGGSAANTGSVQAGGAITSVTVTGDVEGGGGAFSGSIRSTIASIARVTIGGHLTGGAGESSGSVQAATTLGSVAIAGDLEGGGGTFSGSIRSTMASIAKVTISGDLTGGAGESSGRVQAATSLGSVAIAGDLVAGTGEESGGISAQVVGVVTVRAIDGTTPLSGLRSAGIAGDKLNRLIVAGSILGGAGGQSGFVEIEGDLGAVAVRGNLEGGSGVSSGAIVAHGRIASVSVSGNLEGGDGFQSGQIVSGFDPLRVGDMGVVKVLGRLEGGVGDKSGSIRSGGKLTSLIIGTAGPAQLDVVIGGNGERSGSIESQGLLGSLKIIGNLVGGQGDFSGSVRSVDRFEATGEVAGDLGVISITGQLRGGDGIGSGSLKADGNLRSLTAGSWNGGVGVESGSVQTGLGIVHPGASGAIRVLGTFQAHGFPGGGSASILIGGNLSSLSILGATAGATVRVGDALGVLSIRSDVSDSLVTARGQVTQGRTTDVAIGSIAIAGSVTDSEFLAGYRVDGLAVNPDAQIGSVVVTGAWTRSSLAAGVVDADDDGFGDGDDVLIDNPAAKDSIVARIASIVIGAKLPPGTAVSGTAINLADHYGFVAQQIVKMRVGAFNFPLTAATGQVFEQDTVVVNGNLGATGNDVSIREVV